MISDADADIVIFYDYGNSVSGVWVMQNNSGVYAAPESMWSSDTWDATRSIPMSSDFNEDLITDIAALYDYGGAAAAAIVLESNGAMFTNRVY